MTIEEAVRIARSNMPIVFKRWKAIKTLINCAEKQIPKKPIFGTDYWTDKPRCARCSGHVAATYMSNYCRCCGQAIDWSEQEASDDTD